MALGIALPDRFLSFRETQTVSKVGTAWEIRNFLQRSNHDGFPGGLVFTSKRLGTVGFHFQAVGNGWFPLSSGWERLVFTSKRLGTVSYHFQAVGSLMQRLVIRPSPR